MNLRAFMAIASRFARKNISGEMWCSFSSQADLQSPFCLCCKLSCLRSKPDCDRYFWPDKAPRRCARKVAESFRTLSKSQLQY